jgi:DNA-binding response OmpR family regulator
MWGFTQSKQNYTICKLSGSIIKFALQTSTLRIIMGVEMTKKLLLMPKVLVVSNQQTTGILWSLSLREQKINVFFEPAVERAIEQCADANPDLIIIDINSSADKTIQLIKDLREITFAPMILLTRHITEEELLEAYTAGLDDCMYKPLSPSIFVAKIRVWLRHSKNVPISTRDSVKIGGFYLIPSSRTLIIGDDEKTVQLTNLELSLFYYLMNRSGHIVSADELIHEVWGYAAERDFTTLKNLIYRLRRKIEPDPASPRFIQTEMGGYKFVP